MREIGFQRTYIFKIFRGSMPPDPPRKVRLRRTITFSITYEHPLENLSYAPEMNVIYCWLSHDVTKFQTSELLILLRFYFHDV